MYSEIDRYRFGAEAGFGRLDDNEKITAGLRLLDLVGESIKRCNGGRRTAGALRSYISKIENLLAVAKLQDEQKDD